MREAAREVVWEAYVNWYWIRGGKRSRGVNLEAEENGRYMCVRQGSKLEGGHEREIVR